MQDSSITVPTHTECVYVFVHVAAWLPAVLPYHQSLCTAATSRLLNILLTNCM